MNAALILMVLGALGALVDIGLHFTQLFPRFAPSLKTTGWITLVGSLFIVASCLFAFNLAALLIGLFQIGMAAVSIITGKEPLSE